MIAEHARDAGVDFGVPDRVGVKDVLDGEVEATVAAEQRPDTERAAVVVIVHEDSGKRGIPGQNPLDQVSHCRAEHLPGARLLADRPVRVHSPCAS